ncbi:hypothetical protein Sjap_022824 [Stephania japonica]|uniref:Uncharacterized protein n=1 Tax=Stephania japonica TaxID=461633 RepID=A0AAP0ESN3_9MAGN
MSWLCTHGARHDVGLVCEDRGIVLCICTHDAITTSRPFLNKKGDVMHGGFEHMVPDLKNMLKFEIKILSYPHPF